MFYKKRLPIDGNVPPVGAATKMRLAYFSVFEESNRQNRYLWLVVFVLATTTLILVASIFHMLPLQREVPYFLTSDPNVAGRVVPASIVAQRFDPTIVQTRYHVEEWVSWLWTIDPALSTDNLKRANVLTSGAATKVLSGFLNQEKVFNRLENDPTLKREATILDTNFIVEGVVIVRLALNERINGELQKPKYKSMTIHYVLVTPQTKADADRSPIGLTITDFSWSEARA